MAGNGNKLHISHVGATYHPTLTNKPFVLNKLMHIPEIQKNLVSISQLTSESFYMVFHYNCYFVKDKQTMEVMLQGKLKEGLYQLDFPHQNTKCYS